MEANPHAATASVGHAAMQETRHSTPRTYLIVFAWLTVLTILEVLVTATGLAESVRIPVLIVIAIIKALLVVLFYMHLLYDSKWFWFPLVVPIGFVLLLARYLFQH